MTEKRDASEPLSLSRWSRRKLEAGRESAPARANAAPAAPAPSSPAPAAAAAELPSVESLGFDSDFAAFLRPEVDEKLRRAALKQLFRDPRFNVMDGLDTYIDDYTKADPIAPEVVQDLLRRGFSAVASVPAAPPEAPPGSGTSAAAATLPAVEPPSAAAIAPTQPPSASEPTPEEPPAPRSS